MPRSILVVGGTGFLGSHLSLKLLEKDYQVSIFKRKGSSLKRVNTQEESFHYIDDIDQLSRTFDAVFLLATSYGRHGESREEIFNTNIDLPLRILNKIFHERLEIHVSGTSLPEHLNDYAQSKWSFIKSVRATYPQSPIFHYLIEHFFGPSDNSFIGYILNSLSENKNEINLTSGSQKRDFIYYKDVVDALIFIFEKKVRIIEDIPVGTGVEFSIREIVEKIKAYFPKSTTQLNWGAVPLRTNEVMSSRADLRMLNSLGWKARYSIESAISDFLK